MSRYLKNHKYKIYNFGLALKKNKKVIAVPRYKIFGEHVNNHQKDIEEEFSKRGWIIGIDSVEKLDKALDYSKKFNFKKYQIENDLNLIDFIQKYIDK